MRVTIERTKLLEKLKANRSQHREAFLKAQEGYRITVIEELEDQLKRAREGKTNPIALQLFIQAPTDQTKDYDRVISMFEMSLDDKITLEEREFSQYVMDDWSWKQEWNVSNSVYMSKTQ